MHTVQNTRSSRTELILSLPYGLLVPNPQCLPIFFFQSCERVYHSHTQLLAWTNPDRKYKSTLRWRRQADTLTSVIQRALDKRLSTYFWVSSSLVRWVFLHRVLFCWWRSFKHYGRQRLLAKVLY